jgi:hypothetical protein
MRKRHENSRKAHVWKSVQTAQIIDFARERGRRAGIEPAHKGLQVFIVDA